MPDVTWILDLVQNIFGNEIVKWIVTILLPFAIIFALLWLIKGIIEIIKSTFIPLFYNAEQKRRIQRRQRFADHIESEIRRLNQREDWSDFRFAELEAEVEMEGIRRGFSIIPFIKRSSTGLRREKSLSRALSQSQERIILVEGEPGSGKSVALRHVALAIAKRAAKSKKTESLVPIYVNLKELRRENNQPINRQVIESFVIKTLKRINDRDIEKFIDDEFQIGLENGSWFFLFDSFDEIPEVLGAKDADIRIREYADAISDFLHGLNACRGVVASRYFKGPSQVGWPRFRILGLSKSRQKELIDHSELKPETGKLLLGNLETAEPEIQKFVANPLFLGLLIGYVQSNETFPQHSDIVFDAYINYRLLQDKERVAQRFSLGIEEIREVADEVAFCMSASHDLGLSPTRGAIKKSLLEQDFTVKNDFDNYLDALEFMKLARSDTTDKVGEQRVFSFSHRRFQEYFPTKLVLERGNITIGELLTNPRWRETAVVICQTQSVEVISPLIETAWSLLFSYWDDIDAKLSPLEEKEFPIEFPWPDGCLHLLDLLQDGFVNRYDLLPENIRKVSGAIVYLATILGSLPHRIWALEVAGIAPNAELLKIIRPAIEEKSRFLSDIAYRQAARLNEIPDDIKEWIRKSVLKKLLTLGIFSGGNSVYAQVSRLANPKEYVTLVRGIQFAYWIDIVSSIIISGIIFVSAFAIPFSNIPFIGAITLRTAMIIIGLLALLAPSTVYGEDEAPFYRMTYIGILLSMLLPIILLLFRSNSYFLIPLLYAQFLMPSVMIAVSDIPFEKSLVYLLFSPLFVLRKGLGNFRSALYSLRNISFTKSSKRILLIGIALLTVYCVISIVSIKIWGVETGGAVSMSISLIGMLYGFYQMGLKIFLVDRNYAKAWKKWLRESGNEINISEIITVLPVLSTRYAPELIEVIRKYNMLQPSKEALHFMNQLAILVEEPLLENEYSQQLSPFLDDIRENKLKTMLLDELFQSIQKMKSQLQ